MDAWVECRSDYDYAGRPVAFGWQRRRLEVHEVIAQWLTPEEKKFRVLAADGQVFELIYTISADQWKIRQL